MPTTIKKYFFKHKIATVAGAIIAISVIVFVSLLLFYPKQHFTDDQIEEWAGIAAEIDSLVQYHALIKPQEHNGAILAVRLNNQSIKPLDIWEELEPLLRLKKPSKAQFKKMSNLLTNLSVLCAVFTVDEKFGWGHLEQQVDEIREQVWAWKRTLNQP